ncbi:DUF4398 domain-containing protein [Candidatus Bathyarchaeota archaeon]|nr:MAG: DUF4398 domain-containing protein [Candidatus Bathyarchaeota archaeon]
MMILLFLLLQVFPWTISAESSEVLSVNEIQVPELLVRGLPNTIQFNITNNSQASQNCTIRLTLTLLHEWNVTVQPGVNLFNLTLIPPEDTEVGPRELEAEVWCGGQLIHDENRSVRVVGRLLPTVRFSPGSTLIQGQTLSISVEVRDELGNRVGNATISAEVCGRVYNFTESQPGFQSSGPLDTSLFPTGNLTVKLTIEQENYSRYLGLYPLRVMRTLLLDDHNQFPSTLRQGEPTTIRIDLIDGYSGEVVPGGYISLTIGGTTFPFTESGSGSYTATVNITLPLGSYIAEVRGSREGYVDAVRSYEVEVYGSLEMRLMDPEAGGRVILLQGTPLIVIVNITTTLGEGLEDASLSAWIGDERFPGDHLSGSLYTVAIDTSPFMGTWKVTISATHSRCVNTATGSITLTVIPTVLETANSTIRSIKSQGYNVSLAERTLETAYACALDGDAASALQYSTAAVTLAQGSMRATDAIAQARRAVEEARREGRTIGLKKAQTLLSSAEEYYTLGQYSMAENYALRARKAAEVALSPHLIVISVLAFLTVAAGLFFLRWRRR